PEVTTRLRADLVRPVKPSREPGNHPIVHAADISAVQWSGVVMAKTRVVGLDIGSTAVRAAELEFGSGGPHGPGQPTLLRYGAVALPAVAVQDAEVAEPGTVARALRGLWRQARFSTPDVVLGVGNPRAGVRELDLPWLPMPQPR